MRTPPNELIEDLREAAMHTAILTDGRFMVREQMEWYAADWIVAACELLEGIKEGGGAFALTAIELLAGDFPKRFD